MKKRVKMNFKPIIVAAALAAVSCGGNEPKEKENGYSDREALETIFERKSVRSFLARPVEQEKIDLLVRAGMAAPSGMDKRPWDFIVMDDRRDLQELAERLPYASMLKEAPAAIVVCGNENSSSYWYLDCSAATQNILLAAEALGLGAVWTAAYPYDDRMEAVRAATGIPEGIYPLAVIPLGYPKGSHSPKDKYDKSRIHVNKW